MKSANKPLGAWFGPWGRPRAKAPVARADAAREVRAVSSSSPSSPRAPLPLGETPKPPPGALPRIVVTPGGTEIAPATPLVVDGRYEVHGTLGTGGFGVVYAARDLGLARDVALKMLGARWATDERVVATLQREARALASVRSAHVVQVHAFGKHRDAFYFAMERVRGRTLADFIDEHVRSGEAVPLGQALRILEQVADGLAAVHAAGLLHRDVKPENVMIEDETGRPVLVDFGLASDGGPGSASFGGTPGYMSPEQAKAGDEEVSARADVYGLACTAFELFSGKPAWGGGEGHHVVVRQLTSPAPAISTFRPELRALDAVFARALAEDPEQRQESCPELVRELAAGALVRLEPPRVTEPPRAPKVPGRINVLVVDPDAAAAKLCASAVRGALFGARMQVNVVTSAVEAMKQVPDFAILAYGVELDGIEVLQAMRALPGGKRIRVLVLSTPDGLRVSQFRFSMLGVKHFLPTPVSLESLVEVIGLIADGAGWGDRTHALLEGKDDE